MRKINKQLKPIIDRDVLLEKDIWDVEELGFQPNFVHSRYFFNFSKIKPFWFKQAIKKYVRFQSAKNSLSTCHSYVDKLMHFGNFLSSNHKGITPEEITRQIVIKFIEYFACTNLKASTRTVTFIHLRTFHQIVVQEKWLPWPNTALIYSSDFPRSAEKIPRFIPEAVLAQLQQHLHHLPEYMQRFINLLLETGRRIGEICALPFNCLEQDSENNMFLKINDTKLKKSYLIPISPACIKLIKIQQQLVQRNFDGHKALYLFPSKMARKTPHVTARYAHILLNKLAEEYSIKDVNGELWHFYPHQFRHTVGTRMINAGVSQVIVQRYLGHESPEMTARYAHIHNETLKAAFNSYQSKLIDIRGEKYDVRNSQDDAKWLQHKVMAQALPNGICGLPSPQQRCPHANACLSCTHFRTHKEFLPQHHAQLVATNKIIEAAKTNGWQRQIDTNLAVKENLEKIITSLEREKNDK